MRHLSFFSSSLVLGGDGGTPPRPPGDVRAPPPPPVDPAPGAFQMTNLERPSRMSWILRFRAAFLSAEVAFPAPRGLRTTLFFAVFLAATFFLAVLQLNQGGRAAGLPAGTSGGGVDVAH